MNAVENLKSLLRFMNFIDMTGVRIMCDGIEEFSVDLKETHFRCKWQRFKDVIILVDIEGHVYMRYGSGDITITSTFQEIVKIMGCEHYDGDDLKHSTTPRYHEYYNMEDVWEKLLKP